jgi:hypothetical protein
MRTTDTRFLNWRRPIPKQDPEIERLMAMCAALASEVTVLRERLDTHERLAAPHGVFSPEAVDSYEPDAEAMAHRDQVRQGQIRRIFRALKDEAERAARAAAAKIKKPAAEARASETA